MGGTKKSGKGGGGGGGGARRNCHPDDRKKIIKDLGVPGNDLRRAGQRLLKTDNGNQRKILNVPSLNAKFYQKGPRLDGELHRSTENNNITEEEQQYKNISEIAAFSLAAAQKVAQYNISTSIFDKTDDYGERDLNNSEKRDNTLRRFYKEFQKVVDSSDVLLEVLDARDPLGCRLESLEKTVKSQFDDRKKIVIILNKADLVPPNVVTSWIEYFQSDGLYVIPFIAAKDGGCAHTRSESVTNLFKLLRQLARGEQGARKHITVGTIGYPNVGKSSIINALKRKDVVGVGNTPGFTTGNTEVDLRSDVRIIDCPGVVMPGEDTGDVVLRNAVKVDQLDNPMLAVERLVQRCDTHQLANVYEIGHFSTADEFVKSVGLRRGRLRQGGMIDEDETCRIILHDWNDGRIGYFTQPPIPSVLFRGVSKQRNHSEGDQGGDPVESTKVLGTKSDGIDLCPLPTFHLCLTSQGTGKKKNAKRHDFMHTIHDNDGGDDDIA